MEETLEGSAAWNIHAKYRTHEQFNEVVDKSWRGPFYFIQGADIQFGFIDEYLEKKTEPNWDKEIKLAEKAVVKINSLMPRPKFFVICGDHCHAYPDKETELRMKQELDFKRIFGKIDTAIPLVCVCGNHDVGNIPTAESVEIFADLINSKTPHSIPKPPLHLDTMNFATASRQKRGPCVSVEHRRYRSSFGDDYFSFWAGGVHFIVLNSQFYVDRSQVAKQADDQDHWLDAQLRAGDAKHVVMFQHVPWFLKDPKETDSGYFAIEPSIRFPLLEKLHKGGVRYVFSGHYHRNSGGFYKDLESITTTAIGGQLGHDLPGLRIVKVLADKITHRYYSLSKMPEIVDI